MRGHLHVLKICQLGREEGRDNHHPAGPLAKTRKQQREKICEINSIKNRKLIPYCIHTCTVKSISLQPHRLQPTRLLCPWDSPGKNTGESCWLPRPPPRDLPNPGIEPESLTSPALAGGFFTVNSGKPSSNLAMDRGAWWAVVCGAAKRWT